MFKHILLPTDGSKLSDRAVQRGIELAEAVDARVTAVHVVPEFRMMADESFVLPTSVDLKSRYEKEAKARALKMLDKIAARAQAAGVAYEGVVVVGETPYEHIIETARKRKCDLIMMASHGRRGLSALLLGSETSKVLTHSKVPVLVVR
ncbi:MAG TPA: universal stress protein [Burkholderiales bacterium]|jgi:nucleotide-binding universal stress UspA family protein|nr:universal stress protein [Burkholderiales bacterium]